MSYYAVDFSINTKKYSLKKLTEVIEKNLGKEIGIPPASTDKNFIILYGKRKGQRRGTTSWCFYTQSGKKAVFIKHLTELKNKLDKSRLLKKGIIPKGCKLNIRIGYFSKPLNGLYESMWFTEEFTKWLGENRITVEIDFYG